MNEFSNGYILKNIKINNNNIMKLNNNNNLITFQNCIFNDAFEWPMTIFKIVIYNCIFQNNLSIPFDVHSLLIIQNSVNEMGVCNVKNKLELCINISSLIGLKILHSNIFFSVVYYNQELSNILNNLEELKLNNCTINFEHLTKLNNLKSLILYECDFMNYLVDLNSLNMLCIEKCKGYYNTDILNCPKNLKYLKFINNILNINIENIELKEMNISYSLYINKFFSYFNKLEILTLYDIFEDILPNIPDNVIQLNILNSSIKSIKFLPSQLKILSIYNCYLFKYLPLYIDILINLSKIIIDKCPKFQIINYQNYNLKKKGNIIIYKRINTHDITNSTSIFPYFYYKFFSDNDQIEYLIK